MLTCGSLAGRNSFPSQYTKASLSLIVAVSFLLIGAQRAHAQGDCVAYCDGVQSAVCPGGGVGCPVTPEECLVEFCQGQRPGGIPVCECRGLTDCTFDDVSVLPPAVCGDGRREGTEECDPGNDPLGLADCDCPGECQEDCTCPPPPGDCVAYCDGVQSAVCPGGGVGCPETSEECLVEFCQGQRPGGIPVCECRGLTDCTFDDVGVLPPAVCGDGRREGTEECDPGDDPLGLADCDCPDQCQDDCTCPPPPGDCVAYCGGVQSAICPGGGVGCPETSEECLVEFCQGQRPGGIPVCECRGLTDCTFDDVSVSPPAVCGDGRREGTEECDPGPDAYGLADCDCPDQCQTDCTCGGPPGQVCGNNIREGTERCDGRDDDACSNFCQANCTCTGEAVPTASEWGMVVLVLSLLVSIKLKFGRPSNQGLT
jgi:hypothetical protein